MKYKVTILFNAEYNTEVDAQSEEEAISLATDKCCVASSGDFDIYDAGDIYAEVI